MGANCEAAEERNENHREGADLATREETNLARPHYLVDERGYSG